MTNPAELPESRSSGDLPPILNSVLMYGVTSLSSPKAARRPGDTHLRAFSHARVMSPSHCISGTKASFSEQPVYAVTFSTMDKSKDCARGDVM